MSKQEKENEEVDLGSLFLIIGRGFNKLFTAVENIFNNFFYFLIQVLLFLKLNIIKLSIAALVGGTCGLFLEYISGKKYESSLYVKPNFKSARQLYSNIQHYDDLVQQKNFDGLSEIFNISKKDAKRLKRFTITPVLNENDVLTSFDELMKSIDTSSAKSYSYEKFKQTFTAYDYAIHQITVVSSTDNIFLGLSAPIITSITNNDYFNNLKASKNENLKRTDALLRKNLDQIDDLHELYKQVLLEESKKVHAGTTIDLAKNNKNSDKELELFNTSLRLNEELIDVNEDLSEKSDVINVVSNFQPIGHKVREIEKNKGFQYALVGFSLMITALLFIKLNSFLKAYEAKH